VKIVVSGGTGFIGTPLVSRLRERGDEVVVLSRDPKHGVEWHPPSPGPWVSQVREADAVVNLAGESIAGGRWTESRKAQLTSSRLIPLRALIGAKPRVLIEASAVGFYGYISDETFDETAARGPGFLAELVDKWESAARQADSFARVALLRFGVVLDKTAAR